MGLDTGEAGYSKFPAARTASSSSKYKAYYRFRSGHLQRLLCKREQDAKCWRALRPVPAV